MKSFIYPEMMVHVPLCTNKTPKNVLIISGGHDQCCAILGSGLKNNAKAVYHFKKVLEINLYTIMLTRYKT